MRSCGADLVCGLLLCLADLVVCVNIMICGVMITNCLLFSGVGDAVWRR